MNAAKNYSNLLGYELILLLGSNICLICGHPLYSLLGDERQLERLEISRISSVLLLGHTCLKQERVVSFSSITEEGMRLLEF